VVIDHTHRKWMIGTVAAMLAAIAIYVPYEMSGPRRIFGGTLLGLIYGTAGWALMLIAGLLGARRKVIRLRVGRLQTWMRAHLWLGLLSVPIVLLHSGFALGHGLTTLLMVLLVLVTLSGVAGAALQHYLPAVMTRQVAMEVTYEQIGPISEELQREAGELLALACAPPGDARKAASPAALATIEPGGALPADAPGQVMSPLLTFCQQELFPYLGPSDRAQGVLARMESGQLAFKQLYALFPDKADTVQALEDIWEERRQLRVQSRMHRWLHGWLFLHVPLSYALLLLAGLHAVLALRY
jgi:hypothetical protein